MESDFFFWESFGVCVRVEMEGGEDWFEGLTLEIGCCSEVSLSADPCKKQNVGNSFKGKGKLKKTANFHWFSYGTACIYRRIITIINVLKLWGNIDLHNSLVKQFM